MTPSMRVLVLGGYGNFGARICRALADVPSIALIVAGRDGKRATDFACEIGGSASGIAFDIEAESLDSRLAQLGIQLVIHTAGPFQSQNYRVAEACAAAGAHYIDLADGRRFVCDFQGAMDDAFLNADKTAISGASTVPALSSAVINALCQDWQQIDSIDVCIAPAQQAPRGTATLAAVLSYCGESISVWSDGRWQPLVGWSSPKKIEFLRMKSRLGALCDIPDLELFPERYQVSERVMFRAAVEVGFAQRLLAVLAALRSKRYIPSPSRFAKPMNRLASVLDFMGSGLGGMVVRVEGHDALNKHVVKEWHIAADGNYGPEIPCMAAILLARQFAVGKAFKSGAMPCIDLLTLAEFEPEFARWGMQTDFRSTEA